MKLMDKLWSVLGLVETEDTELAAEPEKPVARKERQGERKPEKLPYPPVARTPIMATDSSSSPAAVSGAVSVVIACPKGFDDARQIADHLIHNRTIMVNFENADSETTKRTVDFMSGITYAVGGGVQRIASEIFMFVPDRVSVTTSYTADDAQGGLPWGRS